MPIKYIKDIFTIKKDDLREMLLNYNMAVYDNSYKEPESKKKAKDSMNLGEYVKKFEEYYTNLSKHKMDNNEVILPYELADLYCLMVTLMKDMDNPMSDKRVTTTVLDNFIEYNEKVVKGIEKLPAHIRDYIKSTEEYRYGYIISKYIPFILERFGILMLSMLDSNFTTNFNLSPELASIITNVDDSTVEELDKFMDKFLSLNFLPNSKSGIIPGTRYFDKTLADIFEQFDKCNFSKESENFIKSLNEEYTKKCPKKGNDNKELIKSYREKYLEKFTDDNLLSPHDRFGDIKNNTISDEQFLEVRRMLPYLYENLLKGTKSATLEEFNRLKYSKSIMEKVRIHFNICISAIREELYLTVLCEIMCLEAKSEEFILFMKSSFGDLWELGENVINLHLEDVHNAYRTFKFEKFMNNKEHEWEDIFNNESQNTEKQKNLRKEWERIKSQTPYTKKYVPFIEFLLNPIISRKPYENLDLNKEYVQVYYMYLHDYSYEIANEMSKYSDLECFKEITISLIDSYSKKLFEIYVNKEKYKSEKYYKYKNRYKNLDNLFKPIISKIFRDIAENELKKNNNKDKK